eukprot:scaffold3935_cov142-Skeletonema_menzelii.AAC.5
MGKALGGRTQTSSSLKDAPRRREQCRTNSDKLLVLLAISVCIISVAPIFLHSHDENTHPHHKTVLKGSLDNFVEKSKTVTIEKDALGRNVPAEPEQHLVVENKAEKEDENIEEEKDIQNNVDAVSKTNFNTPSDGDGENNNNNSIRAANGKTTSAEVVNANTKSDPTNSITADKEEGKDVKNENYKPSLRQKAHPLFGNNSSGSEHELHPVAHLNCADHGGPFDPHIIDEMVYWSDIPTDADYLSPMQTLKDPYTPDDAEKFLTFEPDIGGWNNVRMAMETALVLSHAMGRTLVLPPEHKIYNFERSFGFKDLFHLDAVSGEHSGFKVITMEEFLVREAMQGKMVEYGTNTTLYPPQKRMSWGYGTPDGVKPLFEYLRKIGNTPHWSPYDCALAIPSSTEPDAVEELKTTLQSILDGSNGKHMPTLDEFNSNPTPVDAPMVERMREMISDKLGKGDQKLCLYDKPRQQAKLLHLKSSDGARYLTHFYAFIFFADWKQDVWSKRFVRDHLRYADDIMCAAARVVEAVRERARKNKSYEPSRDEGIYDALHVRRDDFKRQYPTTILPADKMFEISKDALHHGSTLYIATDEKVSNGLQMPRDCNCIRCRCFPLTLNKTFFKPFSKNYDVVFLDDFLDLIPTVHSNYYGMIDQLVAYKSQVFFGTWLSSMSGYVNRMRGYYIAKKKLEGYKDGSMPSYYFFPEDRVNDMRQYKPIR